MDRWAGWATHGVTKSDSLTAVNWLKMQLWPEFLIIVSLAGYSSPGLIDLFLFDQRGHRAGFIALATEFKWVPGVRSEVRGGFGRERRGSVSAAGGQSPNPQAREAGSPSLRRTERANVQPGLRFQIFLPSWSWAIPYFSWVRGGFGLQAQVWSRLKCPGSAKLGYQHLSLGPRWTSGPRGPRFDLALWKFWFPLELLRGQRGSWCGICPELGLGCQTWVVFFVGPPGWGLSRAAMSRSPGSRLLAGGFLWISGKADNRSLQVGAGQEVLVPYLSRRTGIGSPSSGSKVFSGNSPKCKGSREAGASVPGSEFPHPWRGHV